MKDNDVLSADKCKKTQGRKLKRRRKARYRRIKKYYKSIYQYEKERLRRKLCWLLSGKYEESEIAEMLGISRRTVIRDMNKIKPYYFRLSRVYFSKLEQERIKEFNAKLEAKLFSNSSGFYLRQLQNNVNAGKYANTEGITKSS